MKDKHMTLKDYMSKLLILATGFVLSFVLFGSTYCLIKAVQANGEVSYCYVEYNNMGRYPFYSLRGYRPWRSDRDIGVFLSIKEANDAAVAMKCLVDQPNPQ